MIDRKYIWPGNRPLRAISVIAGRWLAVEVPEHKADVRRQKLKKRGRSPIEIENALVEELNAIIPLGVVISHRRLLKFGHHGYHFKAQRDKTTSKLKEERN